MDRSGTLPCVNPVVYFEHYVDVSRIHDHLLTRLSNDDDLEKNLSTFANEMASTAMILGTSQLCLVCTSLTPARSGH